MYNTARFRRTRILGSLCLWAGIMIAMLLFLLGTDGDGEQRRVLLVLMGVLPLVAGIWDAYSHKKAEKELIKQYGFMSRVFLKARKLLDSSADITFQRQVLRALGQAALDEGAEWLLMHRERPLEHGRL
jgi:cadmium resistance protein CadD (predicted permease)